MIPRHHRPNLTFESAHDDVPSLFSRFIHVDMRISLIANQSGTIFNNLGRDIRMQIKANGDWQIRCHLANPFKQSAFAIDGGFGDHGTMQVEKTDIASFSHRFTDCIAKRPISLGLHRSAWRRMTRDGSHDIHTFGVGNVEKRPETGSRPFK